MRYLTYAYLLRVPLLTALALPLFTYSALNERSFIYSATHGLFDLNVQSLGIVTAQILLLVTTLAVITSLVFDYGPRRFGIPQNRRVSILLWCFYALIGLYFLARAFLASVEPLHLKLTAAAIGAAVAAMLVVLGWLLWDLPARWLGKLIRHLPPKFGPGYLDSSGRLLPGHIFASACLAVLFAVYVSFAVHLLPLAAALTSLLTLLLLAVFLFAGMAFFFDYFRFPFLLLLGTILFATAWFTRSDEYFEARTPARPVPVSPRQVLEGSKYDTAIIVCTQGGGIQAGAWAARVLTGLDIATEQRFSSRLRLISSVSGGSVGAMYFTASYRQGISQNHDEVVQSAKASSLDQIAFGLVYRDLVRVFVPWLVPKLEGRGSLTEQTWGERPTAPASGVVLSDWRKDVLDGTRPANIFNSMIAETGQRFLMSTVDLGKDRGRRELYELYPDFDLRPVTAARLSSTFPYVSPASRIDAETKNPYHFVDGGYYDNFGVETVVDFLLQATRDGSPVSRILIVEILAVTDIRDPQVWEVPARGWAYQLIAPVTALLAMQASSQISRNAVDLSMLVDILKQRRVTTVERVRFIFPLPQAPLSWHLTRMESANIEKGWSQMQKETDQVTSFLSTK